MSAQITGDLRGELRRVLQRYGPEAVATELRELVSDLPLFVTQLSGTPIWAVQELHATPPWQVYRLERAARSIAGRAGLEHQVVRMGWGRLMVGMRGERETVGRAIQALQQVQATFVPRFSIELHPSTGRWAIFAPDTMDDVEERR